MYGMRLVAAHTSESRLTTPGSQIGGMRVLVGLNPRVDVAIVEVLALPAERAGGGPCLDDEVVRLLEALPVVRRRRVVGDALASGAAHPAGDQPAARDHVDHGKLLDQPQRVVPDRQNVAEQDDLGAIGGLGEDGRLDVHRAAHAEGRAVVLVEHDAVEAHLLGIDALVEVAVVEIGAYLRVIDLVAEGEVLDRQPGRAEIPGLGVLVRSLREMTYEHRRLLGHDRILLGCGPVYQASGEWAIGGENCTGATSEE